MNISDPGLLDNLDIRQKQSLIGRELGRWRADVKRRVQVTLGMYNDSELSESCDVMTDSKTGCLEMLLLLLWRHLVFYSEGRHVNNPDLKGSISHTLRFASSPDVDTLKSEAARKLAPVLQRLQALELVSLTLSDSCVYTGEMIDVYGRRRRR